MLYDQMIAFARKKQRGRRCNSIHKNVRHPMVIMAVGDRQGSVLEELYAQLEGRWSGQLDALQLCYCYVEKPYQGERPILQVKLELPETDVSGAGILCGLPETLKAVNALMSEIITRLGRTPQITMQQAEIHLIAAPEDPAGSLLTDLAAVVKGRLEDFGAICSDCRLYLRLPQQYQREDERKYVCQVLDQLAAADAQNYVQPVLLPVSDGEARVCRLDRVFNAVMFLDEMNENFQCCNIHGEQLTLLADLIENEWADTDYLQTAGVQEGSAGPEYWLAHAADELCTKAMRDTGEERADETGLCEVLVRAAQQRLQGMERALNVCRLFLPGRVERLTGLSLEEGEQAVFGNALNLAYDTWLAGLPALEIPKEAYAQIDAVSSVQGLDGLADSLLNWAKEREDGCAPPPVESCQKFRATGAAGNEAMRAARFRDFLCQMKYTPKRENEERVSSAVLAQLCAKYCRERIRLLQMEQTEFANFAQAVQQIWSSMRAEFNHGNSMPIKWIAPQPDLAALRRAGALAERTGDPTEAFTLIADCVELDGNPDSVRSDPLLFCRFTISLEVNAWTRPITQGVSAGRLLKFASISHQYDEQAVQRVLILMKARA